MKTGMNLNRVAFLASDSPEAREAASKLAALHGNADPDRADCVVALGGDGTCCRRCTASCPPAFPSTA